MTTPFNSIPSHLLQNKVLQVSSKNMSEIPQASKEKFLEIRTFKIFEKFTKKAEKENFPYFFVLYLHEVEIDEMEKVKELLCKKFKERPMVLNFITNNKDSFYFKHDEEFIKNPEVVDDTSKYDFPQYLRDLNALNENEIIAKVCAGENHLLLRLVNILDLKIENRFDLCEYFVRNFNALKVDTSKPEVDISNDPKFELFKAALDLSFDRPTVSEISKSIIKYKVKIMQSGDYKSIFKSVLEIKNVNLIFFILNNFRDVFDDEKDLKYKQHLSAIACNYPDELKNIFLFLIKSCFPYPNNFDASAFNKCENSIIKNQNELHHALNGGGKKIKLIIDKVFADDKKGNYSDVCYDFNNNSLLKKAFEFCRNQKVQDESKRYEIYVYLKVRGFIAGTDKDWIDSQINDIEKIYKNIKTDIQNLTFSLALPHNEKHLRSLSMKSRPHDCGNYNPERYEKNSLKIDKFYKDLAELPEVFKILKVVDESDIDFQIHFDFSQIHTHEIVFGYQKSWGLAFPDGKIVIGAKDEKIALRTLAHEFTHMAMLIVYVNSWKPYFSHLPDERNNFKKIVDICESLRCIDNVSDLIVPRVFDYTKTEFGGDLWDIELIVRVPEMIANFKGNGSGLDACKKFYPELFDHFYNVTLNDINNYDQKRREIVRKLNDAFGQKSINFINIKSPRLQLQYCSIITTNAPKISIAEIQSCFGLTFKNNVLFVSAKRFMNSKDFQQEYLKIFESLKGEKTKIFQPAIVVNLSTFSRFEKPEILLKKIFFKSEVKFFIVLNDENKKENDEIKVILNKLNVNFSEISQKYSWDDLMPKSKQQLLSRKIKFQNCENRLEDFMNFFTQLPNSDKFLSLCLSKKDLIVNEVKETKNFHMARTFNRKKFVKVDKMTRKKFLEIAKDDPENVSYHFEIENKNVIKFRIESSDVTEDKILEISQSSKFILISSDAGSGKSQSLIQIRKNFIQKNPKSLVYIIDLKLFIKNFAKIEDKVNFKEFFIENFLEDTENVKKQFERIFFDYFYENNKILIFFDGFDEISPTCEEKVLILMKSFEGLNKSQLWITTRSHLEENLRKQLDIHEVYSLNPFKDEIHQFIKSYWNDHKLLGDLEKLSSELIERLKNGGNFVKLPTDPQTLTLFAGACIKDEKIDDEFITTFTKQKIYQKSIVKKIEIWSHERGDQGKIFNALIQSSSSSFAEMHQYFALKSFFKNVEENFGINLNEKWTNDEIIRCGIITSLNDNFAVFQHETFKEFFTADFALKGLKKPRNHDEIFELLTYFLQERENFYVVNMFVSGGLKETKFNEQEIENFSKVLEKIVDTNNFRFLTTVLEKNERKNSVFRFLTIAVMENYESLYKFLVQVFKKMKKDSKLIQLKRELVFTDDIYKIEYPNVRVKKFNEIFDELCKEFEESDNDLKIQLDEFMIKLQGASMIGKEINELRTLITKSFDFKEL